VREAVVVARELARIKQLVGYVVAEPGERVIEAVLREHARDELPEHMVPARVVEISAIPLTPHGKIDHRALPEPERVVAGYQSPTTELGWQLAAIWQEVLAVERVGLADNFFELGGDSVLAMQVIARIASTLRLTVSLRSLFDAASLADFERAVAAESYAFARAGE
jgi:acyl carrier protein